MADLEKVELYSSDDKIIGLIDMAPKYPGQGKRVVLFEGKQYVEGGDPDSFYGAGQFSEVV